MASPLSQFRLVRRMKCHQVGLIDQTLKNLKIFNMWRLKIITLTEIVN